MLISMNSKTQAIFERLWTYDNEGYSKDGGETVYEFFDDPNNFNSVKTGLMDFLKKHGLSKDADSSEALGFIRSKFREKGIPFDEQNIRQNIRNWLNKEIKSISNRRIIFLFCLAFELDLPESEEFITKVFFERPFNFRNAEETIYYFCIKNKYAYSKAEELIKEFNDQNVSCGSDDVETVVIKKEICSIESLNDLSAYLLLYADRFKDNKNTAKKCAERYLIQAAEITDSFKKQTKKKNRLEQIHANKLLGTILGYYNKYDRNEPSKAPLADDEDEGLRSFLFTDFIKLHFPSNENIHKLRTGKPVPYELLRKIIILMHFYCFCKTDQSQNNKERFYRYVSELNDILFDSGFGKLYLRNSYDCLFLYCVKNNDPIKSFQHTISLNWINNAAE